MNKNKEREERNIKFSGIDSIVGFSPAPSSCSEAGRSAKMLGLIRAEVLL